MALKDESMQHRKRIYFDLICGVICSTLALSGIIFITVMYGITNLASWLSGLTFWILYFSLSLICICYGLYTMWKNKHFDEKAQRKDLRPPIV